MGELPYFHGDIDAYIEQEGEYIERSFNRTEWRLTKATWEGGRFATVDTQVYGGPLNGVDVTRPFALGSLRLRPVGWAGVGTVVVQANDWSAPLYIWKAKARARWGWFKMNVWLTACVWGLAKYDRNRLNVRW